MDRLISSFVPCCTLEHNCRFFFKFNSLDNLRTPKNHEFEVLKTSIHKIPAVFKCMFTKLILDPSLAHHSSFEWIVNYIMMQWRLYIEIKKNNFVLMNNLVNIAEFSKKKPPKTYYMKSNLIKFVNKNYNWIMDALFSSYQAI